MHQRCFAPLSINCFVGVAAGSAHIDFHSLGRGVLFSFAFLLTGFLLDLVNVREQSFMWIRKMANFTWWRVLMINMAG